MAAAPLLALIDDKTDKNLCANDKTYKNLCADDKTDKNLCADDSGDRKSEGHDGNLGRCLPFPLDPLCPLYPSAFP